MRAVLGRCWVAATLDQNREWHKTGATFVIGTVFDFKGGIPAGGSALDRHRYKGLAEQLWSHHGDHIILMIYLTWCFDKMSS